jgi:hypothetical protein
VVCAIPLHKPRVGGSCHSSSLLTVGGSCNINFSRLVECHTKPMMSRSFHEMMMSSRTTFFK